MALLLVAGTQQPTSAAETLFPAAPSWVGPTENTGKTTLGDVDADGDLDLLRANAGGGCSLYLNTGGTFAPTPTWVGPDVDTEAVVLADIDADGDLDLVCANAGSGCTLFLNTGGTFAASPAWTGPGSSTYAVAVGDVDNDADLDLVCGVFGSGATLYLNTDGTFETTPAWTGTFETTWSVALGDLDGDGDLDLVLGNDQHPTTIRMNLGGTFSVTADVSLDLEPTHSVALGDMDGDGDLDILRANLNTSASLYRNAGGTFTRDAGWNGQGGTSATFGDVNADGWLDAVVAGPFTRANLYLNSGAGSLSTTSAWTGPEEQSFGVTLGDVDGDGDLDLIRANPFRGATLYRNSSAPFSTAVSWAGPLANSTELALGDVNGDGALDLVRAGHAQNASLYLNSNGSFPATPSWSAPNDLTRAIALVDMDRDGDLDLIRGNDGASGSALYLNQAGTFEAAPSWRGPAQATRSIGVADLNGDGYPDLACGNYNEASRLYLSEGGTLSATPAWSGPIAFTERIALGDVDGDGDLDLACGNGSSGATLFLQELGSFGQSPVWSESADAAFRLRLADVNGDGRLDLALTSSVYLNVGGVFAAEPEWRSSPDVVADIAFADVDQDGDLDRLSAVVPQAGQAMVVLHANVAGRLDDVASWTDGSDVTHRLALGDVDADGGLDLVRGNQSLRGSTLQLHKSPWLTGGHANPPTRLLPSNPAYVQAIRTSTVDENHVRITFTAFDAEADPLWVVAEFQFEASPTWLPMNLGGGVNRAGPFSTSAAGLPHEIIWDYSLIPFDRRNVNVRLRAVSTPRRSADIQFLPACVASVGRLTPARPAISVTPAAVEFPSLTVGDSVETTLTIANRGTLDLVILDLRAEDPEVLVPEGATGILRPGEARTVNIIIAPRQVLAQLAPLEIRSNDPLDLVLEVPLAAEILALSASSRLLSPEGELPLAQAATILVTPAPGVRIEHGLVFYRAHGAQAFADSAHLGAQDSDFVGLIPGQHVTEAGLDWYVRIENSGVVTMLPAAAPDSVFTRPVAAPTGMSVVLFPSQAGDYPSGEPTSIGANLPEGAIFSSGFLYHRSGGAAAFDSVSLVMSQPSPTFALPIGVIPGGAVGPRGLEYRLRVNTAKGQLLYPPSPASYSTLRTTVTSLEEPETHPGERYRMVAVPLELSLPLGSSLESLLSDQPEFGSYDVTRWRSFRWQPGGGRYLEISSANTATGDLRPEPGRAFWLVARESNRVNTAPVAGRSITFTPLTLEPGWNQIGSPYAYRVAWSSVTATGPAGPVELQPPVSWNEAGGEYDAADVSVLEPFEGYWLENPTSGALTLLIPPVEMAATPAALHGESPSDSLTWSVQLTARCGERADRGNFAGVASLALEGDDPLDRREPPMAPGDALSLYFVSGEPPARRGRDLRPPLDGTSRDAAMRGQRWLFDVARSGEQVQAAEVDLTLSGVDRVPAQMELRLVDRTTGRVVDPRREGVYRFVSGARRYVTSEKDARFELLVGTPAFIDEARRIVADRPLHTRLLPVYPNPVAGSSVVRFELARAGQVRLEVYDSAGRRLRVLAEGEHDAGRYELAWNGKAAEGRRLPPGVYLIRLAASDRVAVTKVVAVR